MIFAKNCLPWTLLVALPFAAMFSLAARGQVIFVDEFDDTGGVGSAVGDGIVDVTAWRAPFGEEGSFLGRTQFRFDLPATNVATTAAGSADGKVAVLNLDTFDSISATPGSSFLGTDLISKRNFARGGGLRMTTRMRVDTVQGGLVGAPFLYDVQRDIPAGSGNTVRDEIDHELLTNWAVGGSGPLNGRTRGTTLTNVWDDGLFTEPGSGGTPVDIPNTTAFDITEFHDYRTDWTPTAVEYYIDGALVRTESNVIPDDPMRAHVNYWAPNETFIEAYDESLTPATTADANVNFKLELDRMQIERFNTIISGELLVDPSFEDGTAPAANGTGGWSLFNNSFRENDVLSPGLPVASGNFALKTYGPFAGQPDASGAFQNVAAVAGEEFEGQVMVQSSTTFNGGDDELKGTLNYGQIQIMFLDAGGNIIQEAFGDIANIVNKDEEITPILDGRDSNIVQDVFVEGVVDAKAPAGTAFARLQLTFVQLTTSSPADFNNDNFVNGDDLAVWETSFGVDAGADADADADTDGADFLAWQRDFDPSLEYFPDGQGGALYWDDASLRKLTPASTLSASTAVPEPSAVMLLLLTMMSLGVAHRRRT
jgi:hypothetical protein